MLIFPAQLAPYVDPFFSLLAFFTACRAREVLCIRAEIVRLTIMRANGEHYRRS